MAEAFNPLRREVGDRQRALRAVRNDVKNIIDSYHGRFDALAEAVQNAVDGLERRWGHWDGENPPDAETSPEERPTLRVRLRSQSNLIDVVDNGVGIPAAGLVEALIPGVSPK